MIDLLDPRIAGAPPPVITCTVNGVPMRLRHGHRISETNNGRTRFDGVIYSPDGTADRPPVGGDIQVVEDGVVTFGGIIDTPTESGVGGEPVSRLLTPISAMDYAGLAERRVILYTFAPGTLKSWLAILVPYLAHWGVTLDPAQVDGPLMPNPLTCFYMRLDEVLNEFSTLTNGDYLWEITANKHLRMFTPATTPAPFDVVDGDRNTLGDLTVAPSITSYATRILLLFGDGLHEVTETFLSTGAAAFPLGYWVAGTRGYVTANPPGYSGPDVNEPIGVTAPPYWTFDNATARLTRTPAPVSGTAIRFIYTAQFPTLVYADPPGGIPDPPGVWEQRVLEPDVFDKATAQAHANAYILQASQQTTTIKYRTLGRGVHPGQLQNIQRTARHLNAQCLITDVTISDTDGRTYRDVTAIASTIPPGETWRDIIKSWGSGSSSASSAASAQISGGTGPQGPPGPQGPQGPQGPPGSVGWTGTVNKLPKWVTTSSQGDSVVAEVSGNVGIGTLAPVAKLEIVGVSQAPAAASTHFELSTGTGALGDNKCAIGIHDGDYTWIQPVQSGAGWRNLILCPIAGNVGIGTTAPTVNLDVSPGSGAAFGRFKGTGAQLLLDHSTVTSYSSINFREASADKFIIGTGVYTADSNNFDIGTGAQSLVRIQYNGNVGIGTTSPASFQLETTGDVGPHTPFSGQIGHLAQKWAQIYAAELHVESLIAQQTIATLGGRALIASGANIIAQATSPADTSMLFKYNDLNAGDVVVFEGPDINGAYSTEFVYIATGAIPSGSQWVYGTTRNYGGAFTAHSWPNGAACMNTGQTGAGFIDMYAIQSLKGPSEHGPTIVGNIRNSAAYNDWSPRWAIGNLTGTPYNINQIGAAFGMPGRTRITIDPVGGILMYDGANTLRVAIAPNGTASFSGDGNGVTNINGGSIQTGTITATQIAASTITGGNIAASTITAANLAAGTITAGQIAAGTITSTQIAARSITADRIVAHALTATEIQAGTITANEIAANSITADRLSVSTLSAISANLGTITAGSINAVTINGSTIAGGTVTGGSGTITLDSGGLHFSGSGGNAVIDMNGISITHIGGGGPGWAASINIGGFLAVQNDLNVNGSIFSPNMNIGAGVNVTWTAGTGTLLRQSSSRRYKQNERAWRPPRPGHILDARPTLFDFIGSGQRDVLGFIAEDLHALDPHLVVLDEQGRPEAIHNEALLAHLLVAVQDVARRLAAMEGHA